MKQTLLVALFAMVACVKTLSQTGYIYIHNKSINEANSTDFTCHITKGTGTTTVPDFKLNDKPDYIHAGDIGAGNGSGAGDLWAISSGTSTIGVSATGITGTIYRRQVNTSAWTAITTTGSAIAIDGAGSNACVYISNTGGTGSVYYFNGTNTYQIFLGNASGGYNNATDVSYANGVTAIVSSNGKIYYYNGPYNATVTSNSGWTQINNAGTGNAGARIDLNWSGSLLAYVAANSTTVRTVTVNGTGTVTSYGITVNAGATYVNGSTSATTSGAGTVDIAYDSSGAIYTLANVQYIPCSGTGTTGIVFRYVPGDTYWTEEGEGRGIVRLTGGAGSTAWGTCSVGFADAIWTRATDNAGSHVWLDDERIRTTVTYGNSIMIPVAAGTYTFKEDMPSTSYDLGRFNIYDPTGNTVGSPGTNSATINVSAGETVNIEVINEFLVPKAISLNCNTQILQDFGTGTSTSSTEYGAAVEGTAYHYSNATSVQDGYYFLVHTLTPGSNWFSYSNSYTVADHTGNTNGYLMVVNASYAKDEFYRQRVTNLVPGLQYTISFYLANVLNCNPIKPNIKYGLQDLSGNVIVSASTGDISTNGTWQKASFTFTATTSTADLFLSNNNIGGLGNDVALDDIALNPVITTLGANQITPTVAPNLCINSNYTFSNSVTGGLWYSSNSSIASININTGKAQAKGAGKVIITYEYTNQVGCVSDTSRELDVTAPPTLTASDMLGNTACLNQKDSLYALATGTAGPFSYAWVASPSANSGLTTANIANVEINPTAAGSYTYTVTATDQVGCTASKDVALAVSANTAPTVKLDTTGNACVGGTGNFQLKATVTGGTPTFTYAWSGTPGTSGIVDVNAANTSASPTAAGIYTYTVKVKDQFCTVPVSKTVTAFASPTVAVSPGSGNVTLCSNGALALTAVPTPTGTYSYSWSASGNGNGMSGNPTTQAVNVAPTGNGTYTYNVSITDANGCKATGSTTQNVTFNALINAPTINITSPSSAVNGCTGQGSVNLRATVTNNMVGSTISNLWSGPGTITNPTSLTTATAVPTSTGVFTLTSTSTLVIALGNTTTCTSAANTPVVTSNLLPGVTTVSYAQDICTNTKDTVYATATGGTTPYSYAWTVSPTPGATVATPNAATSSISVTTFGQSYTFTMTITDANLCTATNSKTITALNKTGPSYSSINAAASVCANSTINLSAGVSAGTASSSLSYAWSGTGSATANGIVNANSASTTAVPTVAGTYKYYIVTTDGAGCKATDSTGTQTIKPVPSVSPLSNNPAICGTNTDSLNLFSNPSGGTGSYTSFAWTTSVTGQGSAAFVPSASEQNPGVGISGQNNGSKFVFNVTVTDANGCTGSGSTATINVSATPSATATSALATTACAGQNINLTGKVTSTTTAPYTYSWTPSSNSSVTPASTTVSTTTSTAVATTTTAGNYQYGLTVVDANNCTATALTTTVIAINDAPTASIAITQPSVICKTPGTQITLTATPSGGTGTYSSYAWSGTGGGVAASSTTSTTAIPTTSGGTYTITVTDNSGCTGTGTSAAITLDLGTPTISFTCGSDGGSSGDVKYVALTENVGNSWAWSTSNGSRFYTDKTLNPATDGTTSSAATTFVVYNGTYNVAITKSNGCSGSGSITVTPATCSGIVLASSTLNFNAQKQNGSVLLTWSTITEKANDRFDVERSSDGTNWQTIGSVAGLGGNILNNYKFTDAAPITGPNYYRLKQVNTDGNFAYSVVRTVRFTGEFVVHVYPNPATDFLVLEFNSDKEEKAAISIQTSLGSTVFLKEQTIVKGLNRIKLNQIQPLAQGAYVITLATTDNIYRSKFVKGSR